MKSEEIAIRSIVLSAVEFGYKACESGRDIEFAKAEATKLWIDAFTDEAAEAESELTAG